MALGGLSCIAHRLEEAGGLGCIARRVQENCTV